MKQTLLKKLLLPSLLLLTLSACNFPNLFGYSYSLYVLETEKNTGELFKEVKCSLPDSPDHIQIRTLLLTLLDSQNDLFQDHFPTNITLYNETLSQTGILELEFSPEYSEITGIKRTATDYAITLTLTQLPNVTAVRIIVFGEEHPLEPALLRPSDLLTNTENANS